MVRKIVHVVSVLGLICAILCAPVQAATHSIYDNGTLSSTYTTYFRDILSGVDFNDNYVAFRSGQYSYTMVVGDLDYSNNIITLNGDGFVYDFSTEGSNYNSQLRYTVSNIDDFSINCGNYILYSDVGQFPQLIERGVKYEILTFFLLFIALLCTVIRRVFYKR